MVRAPSSSPDVLTEESDADVTSQFLAAERTATDLEPFGADATGEIDAIDIIEVVGMTPTPRPAAAPVLTPRVPMRPPPTLPPLAAHPSSIAPMALDLGAPRVSFPSLSSWSPTPTGSTTMQLARAAGVPAISARVTVIVTSVIGMGLIAGAVGAALGYAHVSHRPAAAADAPAMHTPRTAVVLEAREEITESPLSAPAKAAATQEVPGTGAASPSASAPPPTTQRTTASRGGTGVIHVVGAVSGALVDGAPHRVVSGAITVACGRHRVKLPGRSVRIVDVPCGGSATF